uniref:Lipase n=1 Tax=Culicoides sonorensis TaxID=179676 RepID=A0A336L0B9_CULSO
MNVLPLILLILTFNFIFVLPLDDYVSSIIQNAGYTPETHNVETEDGFILTLHRLKKDNTQVVFLMHGLFQTASVWVYDGPKKSLAFMLFEAGYDVWMLSARGTSLSAQHKTLSPEEEKYWDFSFHEIGFYDLPATVDYILGTTRQAQLHYVGHSQGGMVFLIFLSMRPQYNAKIRSSYLLAPASYMIHFTFIFSPLLDIGYKSRYEVAETMKRLKFYSIGFRTPLVYEFVPAFCDLASEICMFISYLFLGPDSGQLDKKTFVSKLAKYTADNIALKQLWHFIQLMHTDRFQMYDNMAENQAVYGSDEIPEYNLTNINIPLVVFYGTNDVLVNASDVETLLTRIRTIDTIKLPWGHMDFISGKDAPKLINRYIIKALKTYPYVAPPELTTVPPSEYRANPNFFEWISEVVGNFSKMITNRN